MKTKEKPIVSELPWFRLVANKDGSIATCEHFVGARDDKGRSVHFVQALNAEDAIQKWAARYRNRTALTKKARRKNIELGLCRNNARHGVAVASGLCRACANSANSRRRAVQKGCVLKVQRNVTPEQQAAAEVRYRKRHDSISRATLAKRRAFKNALEAFDEMPPARFRGWLVAQIQEQQDKIDAKLSAKGLPPQAESNTARVIAAALAQPRRHGTLRIGQQ